MLIESWRHHYNTVRPHSSLGYRPPAPQTVLPRTVKPPLKTSGLSQTNWTTHRGQLKAFRSEDLGPFVERQVGRDDDRAAFVALGDDLEDLGPRCQGRRKIGPLGRRKSMPVSEVADGLGSGVRPGTSGSSCNSGGGGR